MFRKWGMFALAKQGRLYLLALVKRPFMHCTFVIVIVSLQDCHHDTLVLAPLLIKKDKFYMASQTMGGQVNFFSYMKIGSSEQRVTTSDTWNSPK